MNFPLNIIIFVINVFEVVPTLCIKSVGLQMLWLMFLLNCEFLAHNVGGCSQTSHSCIPWEVVSIQCLSSVKTNYQLARLKVRDCFFIFIILYFPTTVQNYQFKSVWWYLRDSFTLQGSHDLKKWEKFYLWCSSLITSVPFQAEKRSIWGKYNHTSYLWDSKHFDKLFFGSV